MKKKLDTQWCNRTTSGKSRLTSKEVNVLNVKGMIHWEMLERNQSKGHLYWQQQRVVDAIAQIYPESTNVLFIYDITLKNSPGEKFFTRRTRPTWWQQTSIYCWHSKTYWIAKRLKLMMDYKVQMVISSITSPLNITARLSLNYTIVGNRWSKITVTILIFDMWILILNLL